MPTAIPVQSLPTLGFIAYSSAMVKPNRSKIPWQVSNDSGANHAVQLDASPSAMGLGVLIVAVVVLFAAGAMARQYDELGATVQEYAYCSVTVTLYSVIFPDFVAVVIVEVVLAPPYATAEAIEEAIEEISLNDVESMEPSAAGPWARDGFQRIKS